ncbi:hypothetical protein MLD38_000879 [Melastoma candidum]|uniref:Uncharacterized protein n=1 Tax=Melastoma candidum TaxID=119954 RepID=A0ACB9SAZ8_9MYRT|nr:hypothetical protein MLD38_000879 [Melastoma candidum]
MVLVGKASICGEEQGTVREVVPGVVSLAGGDRKTLTHPEVTDMEIKCSDNFVWAVDVPLRGKAHHRRLAQKTSNGSSLSTLARMLKEGIHTDIIVNASDGSIGAHRAVLASRSPEFRSMFSYDLKEEEPPAIDIPDMSIAACEVS